MKELRIYAAVVFGIALFTAIFGLMAPAMISAKNDVQVMMGFVLIVVGAPILAWVWWWAIKHLLKTIEGNLKEKHGEKTVEVDAGSRSNSDGDSL